MKRLYIRPQYRGQGLSRILWRRIIEDAGAIGCQYIRLDAFPFMEVAIHLYQKCGSESVDRCNDNPAEDAVFMQKKL